jgi:hypothetical protein
MAFPLGPQFARAAAVPLLEKFGGDDAIRPEVAKFPASLAPGGQEADGLSKAYDRRQIVRSLSCKCSSR